MGKRWTPFWLQKGTYWIVGKQCVLIGGGRVNLLWSSAWNLDHHKIQRWGKRCGTEENKISITALPMKECECSQMCSRAPEWGKPQNVSHLCMVYLSKPMSCSVLCPREPTQKSSFPAPRVSVRKHTARDKRRKSLEWRIRCSYQACACYLDELQTTAIQLLFLWEWQVYILMR